MEPYSTKNSFAGGNQQTSAGNLVSSSEWFSFGSEYNETYIGNNFMIRGIKSEGWTRNVSQSFPAGPFLTFTMNYALTYYFSLPSWDWFNSSESRIPTRVELLGQRITDYGNGTVTTYDFHHYYDYVQFFPDDYTLAEEIEFDISDFYEQCNVTSYCTLYPTNKICSITKGILSAIYMILQCMTHSILSIQIRSRNSKNIECIYHFMGIHYFIR